MDEDQIRQVRDFNRAVTQRIGALDDDYLGRGRPLAESRLLFEIGPQGVDLRQLRARLSLDSGYLSRLLRSLEAQGLVASRRCSGDGRARRAVLTRKGRREWDALDGRSQAFATVLLEPLGTRQRERLIAAMAEVQRFMRAAAVVIEAIDPRGDEARTCMTAYFRELDRRFEGGFDPATAAAGPEEFAPPAGSFFAARLDGDTVGCGGYRITGRRRGEIKRMWVAPTARGLGIAQRLLEAIEAHAAGAGVGTLRLDTNRALDEARALYLRNGYREIARYNDNPYADYWFEKRGVAGRVPARQDGRMEATGG